MYPVLLKLFFIFNVFILSEVTGNDIEITKFQDGHPYNIPKLCQHFYTSINVKDKTPDLAKYMFSKPLDPEFVLKQLKGLSDKSKCLKDIIYIFESFKNVSANMWALNSKYYFFFKEYIVIDCFHLQKKLFIDFDFK